MVAQEGASPLTVYFSSFQAIRALFSFFSEKTGELPKTTYILHSSESFWLKQMAPAAQSHSRSKGKRRAQALQVFSYSWQHEGEQGALGISRKGGVGCKHISLRMSIQREEHFCVV